MTGQSALAALETLILVEPTNDMCVRATWLDSEQPSSGWEWAEDIDPRDAHTCATVGWVVYITDSTLALAANRSQCATDGKVQYMGIARIPRVCVVNLEVV
jgi:hypothetical protein